MNWVAVRLVELGMLIASIGDWLLGAEVTSPFEVPYCGACQGYPDNVRCWGQLRDKYPIKELETDCRDCILDGTTAYHEDTDVEPFQPVYFEQNDEEFFDRMQQKDEHRGDC